MAAENYYDVLGLRKGAKDEEVKHAFRELAKTLHPDRNPGDPEAERQFKLINTAYEALKDASRRRAYDEWLAFARKHDRSRLAQWGRLAMLVAVLFVGPSMALYWALVALDLAGPSRKDRTAASAIVNSERAPASRNVPSGKQAPPKNTANPVKTETAALPQPVAPASPTKTEAPASKTDAFAPKAETLAPRTETPALRTEAPAPKTEAPAPRNEAPAPASTAANLAAPAQPAQRTNVPPSASEETSSIDLPAEAPRAAAPAENRQPLRELAEGSERQDWPSAPLRVKPESPEDEAFAPQRNQQAALPPPNDADTSGSARSMARALAELKEPRPSQYDDVPERSQGQTALSAEEDPRSLPRRSIDGEDFVDCERCPRMSVVVAADITPRDPSGRRGSPDRTMAISRSEVTVAEWNACVRDGACAGWRDSGTSGGSRPVLDVSRSEALAYADWLSRKTGKLYRPMKSGGWSRANTGGQRGADPRYDQSDDQGFPSENADCRNGGEWRWLNDYDCNQRGRRARNRDSERATPPREGGDASGFRVARSVGSND